jgi:hypothetical protein
MSWSPTPTTGDSITDKADYEPFDRASYHRWFAATDGGGTRVSSEEPCITATVLLTSLSPTVPTAHGLHAMLTRLWTFRNSFVDKDLVFDGEPDDEYYPYTAATTPTPTNQSPTGFIRGYAISQQQAAEFAGDVYVTMWGSASGVACRVPREIYSLSQAGSLGQVARFIASDSGQNPIDLSFVSSTPAGERVNSGFFFVHNGTTWVRDDTKDSADMVDRAWQSGPDTTPFGGGPGTYFKYNLPVPGDLVEAAHTAFLKAGLQAQVALHWTAPVGTVHRRHYVYGTGSNTWAANAIDETFTGSVYFAGNLYPEAGAMNPTWYVTHGGSPPASGEWVKWSTDFDVIAAPPSPDSVARDSHVYMSAHRIRFGTTSSAPFGYDPGGYSSVGMTAPTLETNPAVTAYDSRWETFSYLKKAATTGATAAASVTVGPFGDYTSEPPAAGASDSFTGINVGLHSDFESVDLIVRYDVTGGFPEI